MRRPPPLSIHSMQENSNTEVLRVPRGGGKRDLLAFSNQRSCGDPGTHLATSSSGRRGDAGGRADRNSLGYCPGATPEFTTLGARCGERDPNHSEPGIIWIFN